MEAPGQKRAPAEVKEGPSAWNFRPSSTLGAGGLVSSVHDMVKWDDALNDDRILSDASGTATWTSAVLENGDEIGH